MRLPLRSVLLFALAIGPTGCSSHSESAPGFSPVGALNLSRSDHAATLLRSGKVLVTGGSTSAGWTATAELYDPVNRTFTFTGSLSTARARHSATLLEDGRVLLVGGCSPGAELYDPETGVFSRTGDPVVGNCDPAGSGATAYCYCGRNGYDEPAIDHTATLLRNGKVLVNGGWFRGPGTTDYDPSTWYAVEAQLYDPATGSFAITGKMKYVRVDFTSTLLDDGTVFVCGGRFPFPHTDDFPAGPVETYDPASGTFREPGFWGNCGRWGVSVTPLGNGALLVAGGKFVQMFSDSSTAVCTPASASSVPSGTMSEIRAFHTGTLRADGTVLVTGGEMGVRGVTDSAELYDPVQGTFTPTSSMNSQRARHTATRLLDGSILVIGGSGLPEVYR